MKRFILHIIFLLTGLILGSGYAMGQVKTITIEKGAVTFNAASTADAFVWYIDGVEQAGQITSAFSHTWSVDTFELSAMPMLAGCAGDLFYTQIIVKEDVTIGDTQVVITSPSPVLVCPVSNAMPNASITVVQVELLKYALADNEEFVIKYAVDDGLPITVSLSKSNSTFNVNGKGLSPGDHTLRITRLAFGEGFRNQVDYSTAQNPPSVTLKVTVVPAIGEIEVVEE